MLIHQEIRFRLSYWLLRDSLEGGIKVLVYLRDGKGRGIY